MPCPKDSGVSLEPVPPAENCCCNLYIMTKDGYITCSHSAKGIHGDPCSEIKNPKIATAEH